MPQPQPRYCRPLAYEYFLSHVAGLAEGDATDRAALERTGALVGAATAVAMHALDDVHPGAVEERFEALAVAVRQGAPSKSARALIAHLHHVLFTVKGFHGNQADYYDPANSYLPQVLARRRGVPISLALVYKAVADRLGLRVCGIGAPGHFLLQVEDESGPLLVDPFHGGRVLTDEDAFRLMEGTLGAAVPRAGGLLRPVTHREWIARLLRNLEAIHTRRAQPREAAAMHELRRHVDES